MSKPFQSRVSDEIDILVMVGDGIGPEITAATLAVLEAADRLFGLNMRFANATIGLASLSATGTTFPTEVLDRARAADGIILGPVSHNDYPPRAEGGINPSGTLRK
jgi:isocitrate/isopropylmalate dehydrogenase